MDTRFCARYKGDGSPPSNRFCRTCQSEACRALWEKVIALSRSHDGMPVRLPPTRAVMLPHDANPWMVKIRVNVTWTLPKEDFLHYVATGNAGMGRKGDRQNPAASPSMTRQEPYVQAIVDAIGGWEIQEIRRAREVQRGT
ncbi:MAG: hypothetical protein A4E37_01906 [Methanoregulaceae archaeon PtaB.Bin056]|nr:MAG: hypothetical protein A4E37_01906 [Methanoregulaceae archaeon PtaB.Bin056]